MVEEELRERAILVNDELTLDLGRTEVAFAPGADTETLRWNLLRNLILSGTSLLL